MITPGGNEAWTAVLMALTDPGDEAIIFEPYYFNAKVLLDCIAHLMIQMALELLNVRPVIAKCKDDLTPELGALPFSEKTRVMILVNPSNPTGFVWPADTVKHLQRACEERKVWLVSDEAYEDFLWDGAKHYSPVGSNVLNLYTLSKSYGMHGWRIGYCAYPPSLRAVLTKIQDTVIINACQFSQALATECLRDHPEYPAKQLAPLAENRSIVWDVVGAYPGTVKTSGAFYFFVKVSRLHTDGALTTRAASSNSESTHRCGSVRVPRKDSQGPRDARRECVRSHPAIANRAQASVAPVTSGCRMATLRRRCVETLPSA